jgi:hypothetical protein
MSDRRHTSPDFVRRKLLQGSAALGGILAAGQLPWGRPAIKSFFGTSAAWAQPTGPACAIDPVEGTSACESQSPGEACIDAGPVSPISKPVFSVTNTGTAAFTLVDAVFVNCPELQLAPETGLKLAPEPQTVIGPNEGVVFTLSCDQGQGPFVVCLELQTDPPLACSLVRIMGTRTITQ